jgi:hypothetical protein
MSAKPDFLGWSVDLEPDRTRAFYETTPFPLEQACCLPCATLSAAVGENVLPQIFTDLLKKAGVDVRQPQEVWGAPDAGFLSGWYVAAGTLHPSALSGAAEEAAVELTPGFSVWLTATLSMERDLVLGEPRFQIEFHWEHDGLKGIASSAEVLVGEAKGKPSARDHGH